MAGYYKLDGSPPASLDTRAVAPTAMAPPRTEDGRVAEWATGDVFEQSQGGWLRHVCRRDELLLHTSGEMTNPLVVEAAISAALKMVGLPVGDVCVFGSGRPVPAVAIELQHRAALLASATSPRVSFGGVSFGDDDASGEIDGVPLLSGSADADSPNSVRNLVLEALAQVAKSTPSYSCPPAGLVVLVHPAQHLPLQRTAKGGVVRNAVEQRFGPFVDFALRRSSSAHSEHMGAGGALADADAVHLACGAVDKKASPRALPGDSLGLATLMSPGAGPASGEASKSSTKEAATDALVQHLKVFLLFAVLLRHLQRFTVRTCHAWVKVAPPHLGICVRTEESNPRPLHTPRRSRGARSNPTCSQVMTNILQTGAAEGLAFLSGVAMAGRPVGQPITFREVASPLVLILIFRQLLHPIIEWCFAYRADIGTAHLWFVLMIGMGRLLCLPLSHLPRRARRSRLVCVAAFLLWRLFFAPTHIGWQSYPLIRRPLFFMFYGDRNYLQIVHNLPLFMLGYVHADVRHVARHVGRRVLPTLFAPSPGARKDGPPRSRPVFSCLCGWLGDRRFVCVALLLGTLVGDPILVGLFIKKIKLLESRPLLVYARSALRLGALAMLLPRRVTPLTAAGRSQLLAYLLHDAVFSVGAQVIAPALHFPSLHTMAIAIAGHAPPTGGSTTLLTTTLAVGELAVYAALCLAVQLALSHPRGCLLGWRRILCCGAAPRLVPALYGRMRLAVRHVLHSGGIGGGRSKRAAGPESAV